MYSSVYDDEQYVADFLDNLVAEDDAAAAQIERRALLSGIDGAESVIADAIRVTEQRMAAEIERLNQLRLVLSEPKTVGDLGVAIGETVRIMQIMASAGEHDLAQRLHVVVALIQAPTENEVAA